MTDEELDNLLDVITALLKGKFSDDVITEVVDLLGKDHQRQVEQDEERDKV